MENVIDKIAIRSMLDDSTVIADDKGPAIPPSKNGIAITIVILVVDVIKIGITESKAVTK